MNKFERAQQGFVLVIVLVVMVILAFMALAATFVGTNTSISTSNSLYRGHAEQAASSGVNTVLRLIDSSADNLASLKLSTCDKPFSQQFTNNAEIGEFTFIANFHKSVEIKWYACVPVKNNVIVEPENCIADYECISVIVAGVACAPETSVTNPTACSTVRYLQGIAILKED